MFMQKKRLFFSPTDLLAQKALANKQVRGTNRRKDQNSAILNTRTKQEKCYSEQEPIKKFSACFH